MIDAITLEVIRHGLLRAAEEVARNLCRAAYNTVVYEIHDYGIGIHDAHGDVVADAPGIAIFTRGNDFGIKKGIEVIGVAGMKPGDAFIVNYPYWSSAHTLDPLVFSPIFFEDRLLGFTSCRVHVLDLNQKDPGYVIDSTDIAEEGLILPLVRLYDGGKPNEDVLNIIRFNSRMAQKTLGDIHAQISACATGVHRIQEMAGKYGTQQLTEAMTAVNKHGELLAKRALQKLPNGTWSAVDYVDSDGVDKDRPVKLQVTVTVTDEEMIVDWTGSDSGVRGPINLPRGRTDALSSLVFKALTTPDTPVVAGNFRPLRVVTEPRSVMHAIAPMPTFTQWTGMLACEVIVKALSKGMQELVPACSGGDVSSMMGLGLNPSNGEYWLEATNEAVGFGATVDHDGEDGIMHMAQPGCRNNPVEVLESRSPMIIESYGYRTDSCGAGKYRGGSGISRTYRFTSPSTGICLVYKTKSPPWPIAGGSAGVPNQIVLNAGTARENIQGGSYNIMEAGDTLSNNTGGGGGFGSPFERDPLNVANDVRNGFVSVRTATVDYGVVFTENGFEVDVEATQTLRSRH